MDFRNSGVECIHEFMKCRLGDCDASIHHNLTSSTSSRRRRSEDVKFGVKKFLFAHFIYTAVSPVVKRNALLYYDIKRAYWMVFAHGLHLFYK